MHTAVLLIGSLTVAAVGIWKIGGWGEVVSVVGPEKLNMFPPLDSPFPWLGLLMASPIVGIWYWCTDQYIVQRVLSGKNETESRRGAIFGAYLKLTPVFLFMIPGMIAFAMAQKGVIINGEPFILSSSDAAFPTLVARLLPAGVKGLVVCGILAALMSSLASLFNSSSMLFTIDFYKKYRPHASEASLVRVGRTATVVVVILGILWIPIMRSIGSVLYNYLQDVQSVLAPGIAAAFLLGVISARPTPKGGMWGMIAGFIIGVLRLGAKVYYSTVAGQSGYADVKLWAAEQGVNNWFYSLFYEVNWLFFSGGMLVFSILVILMVSRFTQAAPASQIEGLTFSSSTAAQRAATRASWTTWDVIHSGIILLFTIAFYIYFW
jgi:SSS family solute:Na+ symporter